MQTKEPHIKVPLQDFSRLYRRATFGPFDHFGRVVYFPSNKIMIKKKTDKLPFFEPLVDEDMCTTSQFENTY